VALKALQAIRTSPLVQQCRKALNDISTVHAVGLYWVTGHAGLQGNKNHWQACKRRLCSKVCWT